MRKYPNFLLLFSLFFLLAACSQAKLLTAIPTQTLPAIPVESGPRSQLAPSIVQPSERFSSLSNKPLTTTHHLHLDLPEYVGWVVTDETYIYWGSSQTISRYPLDGGKIEAFAVTQYDNGTLSVLQPQRSGKWLIFMDTQYPLLYTPFVFRAINLQNSAEYELLSDQREDALPPTYAINGDWVVWTTLVESETAGCSADSMLVVQNIISAERRELDRICIDNNYMWEFNSTIGISKEYIVAAQQLSDTKGGGRRIYLFSRETGQSTLLTGESYGRMPALNGDWVAWLDMRSPDDAEGNTIVLNLKTGEQKTIQPPIFSDEPFLVGNRWLYWDGLSGNLLAVYDLMTDTTHTLRTTARADNEATTGGWYLTERMIVWSENIFDPVDPGKRDVYLHWGIAADLTSLLIEMQP